MKTDTLDKAKVLDARIKELEDFTGRIKKDNILTCGQGGNLKLSLTLADKFMKAVLEEIEEKRKQFESL